MQYSLKFFDDVVRDAVAAATDSAQNARAGEVGIEDVVRSLAERAAFDRCLGSDGVDAALLEAIPPRSTGFFQRFKRAPTPDLSKVLRAVLDDTRFHARHAAAESARTEHFALALLTKRAEAAARVLRDFGFDHATLEARVALQLDQEPAPPEPQRKSIDTAHYAVDDLWDAIEQFIERETSWQVDDWFAPGATDAEIAELEDALGRDLPEDLKASLRRHDGSVDELHDCYELLSCTAVASEWSLVQQDEAGGDHDAYRAEDMNVSTGVQPRFWSSDWVPVLQMGGSTEYLCCDLAPTAGGTAGQLVTFAMDDFDRMVLFDSMHAYLSWLLVELMNRPEDAPENELLPFSSELPRRQ